MTNNNTVNNLFLNQKVVQTATNYTVLASDVIIEVTNTSAARTITLPASSSNNTGKFYVIKDASGGASVNFITVTPTTGTIDGAATATIGSNYGSMQVFSDGVSYFTQELTPSPTSTALGMVSWSTASNTSFALTSSPGNANWGVLSSSASRVDTSVLTTVIAPVGLTVAAGSPSQNVTITQAGVYLISFECGMTTPNNGGPYCQIVKNNTTILLASSAGIVPQTGPTLLLQACITSNFIVNDTIDIRVGQNQGTGISFYSVNYIIQQLPTTYY